MPVMAGELELISRLKARARASDRIRVGIGDDAAVICGEGKDLLACCDLSIEGVHFRTAWATAQQIGHKALAVNLSDIAAMGGVPLFALISIAIPRGTATAFVDDLLTGIFVLAEASEVTIIGGDTSASPAALFVDISLIGECASGKAITRAGAQAGDDLYVTGQLGASAFGLSLLEQGRRFEEEENDEATRWRQAAIRKHLLPAPRLQFGRAVGELGLATAMIDISDGLSSDLTHLLEASAVGAILYAEALPIADCLCLSQQPLPFALHGGEEYELLFTARAADAACLNEIAGNCGLAITKIGKIVAERSLHLECAGRREVLRPAGYEHSL